MAFFQEIRVSIDLVCAAANLVEQQEVETDGGLANECAEYDLSIGVWHRSTT